MFAGSPLREILRYSLPAATCPIPTVENFGALDIQVAARDIIASLSVKKSTSKFNHNSYKLRKLMFIE